MLKGCVIRVYKYFFSIGNNFFIYSILKLYFYYC